MSRVWRYGDDVNTDMLFPGKYTYECNTAEEIRPHLLEDLDPGFAAAVRPGDLVFAGSNFGCGSSREQPSVGLVSAGVATVVARSFARIFYRSAINQGLLLIECPAAVDAWREGDAVSFDAAAGAITVGDATFVIPSPPPEILAIRDAGGLLVGLGVREPSCVKLGIHAAETLRAEDAHAVLWRGYHARLLAAAGREQAATMEARAVIAHHGADPMSWMMAVDALRVVGCHQEALRAVRLGARVSELSATALALLGDWDHPKPMVPMVSNRMRRRFPELG